MAPQVFTIHKIRLVTKYGKVFGKNAQQTCFNFIFFQNNEFLKMFLTISSCGMGNGYEAVMETCSFGYWSMKKSNSFATIVLVYI